MKHMVKNKEKVFETKNCLIQEIMSDDSARSTERDDALEMNVKNR